ncbi:cytochrome P450, partial [Saccharata proteae CBS 121410]
FLLHTPETNYIHVSSELHIKELLAAPQDVLSLHALSKEMLQPKYTMDGLAVEDSMSSNGSVHMRVLAVMLKNNLDHFHAPLLSTTSSVLARELHHLSPLPSTSPSPNDNWLKAPIFVLAKSLIAAGNTLVFFGPSLSHDVAFVDAALRYPEELFLSAEILRLIPRFAVPVLVDRLRPIVDARLANSTSSSREEQPIDCLQFFIDSSRTAKTPWSAQKIVQVILGVWFASVHQPALALVYALDDLCRYPEYVELLRQELGTLRDRADGEIEELPLLDSFLKESARLHPSEAISVRRQAVRPFVFGGGLKVERGEVVCLPLIGILRDRTIYPESDIFDGFRFVRRDGQGGGGSGRFCESTAEYPLWGLGKHVCPGRYYATRILKIVLAHILEEYDVRFPEEHDQNRDKSRNFNWRSSTIPRAESSILFRKRRRESWEWPLN